MKRLIPRFLKYPIIFLYILIRCITRGKVPKNVQLNLSGVLPPQDSLEIIHGGKVKLLHLRERFGDSWKGFNIAYFVSSGLPFAPQLWIYLYKLFGIKVVWNQNGVAYPAWAHEKTNSINKLMEPLHESDFVIYQTEFTKHSAEKFLGVFKGPSEIIVNPVDTKKFKPKDEPLEREPLIVVMSGHHFESKERLETSIETMRELRKQVEAKLLVIGNTQELPRENWIEVVNKFTQAEAPHLYQRAHILLHLKYLDPCPTIVLEALACGLPVVGQGNGGMPELVSGDAGILLPIAEDFERLHYPSPKDVADAIIEIKERCSEFSQNARKEALKFGKDTWLDKHEKTFNELLKK